jgi:hypothetical protein
LRGQFAELKSSTDWTRLRIEPLLQHATSLHRLLSSGEFARENARLKAGVGMLHADLVYFRENLRGLEKVLASEKRAALRRRR